MNPSKKYESGSVKRKQQKQREKDLKRRQDAMRKFLSSGSSTASATSVEMELHSSAIVQSDCVSTH